MYTELLRVQPCVMAELATEVVRQLRNVYCFVGPFGRSQCLGVGTSKS